MFIKGKNYKDKFYYSTPLALPPVPSCLVYRLQLLCFFIDNNEQYHCNLMPVGAQFGVYRQLLSILTKFTACKVYFITSIYYNNYYSPCLLQIVSIKIFTIKDCKDHLVLPEIYIFEILYFLPSIGIEPKTGKYHRYLDTIWLATGNFFCGQYLL